jgi:hypothetical protein
MAQMGPTCQMCEIHMGEADQRDAVTWHRQAEVAQ